jgi:hypothetical protein
MHLMKALDDESAPPRSRFVGEVERHYQGGQKQSN